jgi:hypothetical protein
VEKRIGGFRVDRPGRIVQTRQFEDAEFVIECFEHLILEIFGPVSCQTVDVHGTSRVAVGGEIDGAEYRVDAVEGAATVEADNIWHILV